jgi:hypothetical protein
MPMIPNQAISFGNAKWPRKKLLKWFEFRPLADGERERYPDAVWEHLEQAYPEWLVGKDFDHERELGTCIELDGLKGAPKPGGTRVPCHATLGAKGFLNVITRQFLDAGTLPQDEPLPALKDGLLPTASTLKWVEVGSQLRLGPGSEIPDTDEFTFRVVKTGVNAGDYREVTARRSTTPDWVEIIAVGEVVEAPQRPLTAAEEAVFGRFKQLPQARQVELVDLAVRQHLPAPLHGRVANYDGMAQALIKNGHLDVPAEEP